MKAIDIVRDRYPRYKDSEIIEKYCPTECIYMDFMDCLQFEYCDDCWGQEVDENESYNV